MSHDDVVMSALGIYIGGAGHHNGREDVKPLESRHLINQNGRLMYDLSCVCCVPVVLPSPPPTAPRSCYSVLVTCGIQLLGGYLYFHKAPNAQEFFEETRDKVCSTRSRDTRSSQVHDLLLNPPSRRRRSSCFFDPVYISRFWTLCTCVSSMLPAINPSSGSMSNIYCLNHVTYGNHITRRLCRWHMRWLRNGLVGDALDGSIFQVVVGS